MNRSVVHTDEWCWAQLLKGDKDALYELYQRYYHTLLFTGLKHIPDSDLIKDVIQQQFLYFWEKRDSMLVARNVKGYIIISFLRRLTNDWMKARKTVNLEVAWSSKEEEDFETSCEENLVAKDHQNAVSKNLAHIINTLPARQRELIQLKYYEGLSYDAIVEKTGLTHRTVYNKIHEALGKIRQDFVQHRSMREVRSFILLAGILFSNFF